MARDRWVLPRPVAPQNSRLAELGRKFSAYSRQVLKIIPICFIAAGSSL